MLGSEGSASEGEFGTFVTAFEDTQRNLSKRLRRRMTWKYFELFRSANAAPMKVVKDYIDPLVCRAIEEKEKYQTLSREEQLESSESFLRYLALSTEGTCYPNSSLDLTKLNHRYPHYPT
jgi:hypothetical protein